MYMYIPIDFQSPVYIVVTVYCHLAKLLLKLNKSYCEDDKVQ